MGLIKKTTTIENPRLPIFKNLVLVLFCIVGVLAISAISYSVNDKNKEHLRGVFLQIAEDRIWSLENNLSHDQDILRAIASTMTTFNTVNQTQFSELIGSLLSKDTSFKAVFWVQRGDNGTNHDSEGSPKYPVVFGNPAGPFEKIQGLDMAETVDIRDALFEARDSGQVATSYASPLSKSNRRGTEILVILPIYESGVLLRRVRDRRQHLRGFIVGISEVARIFRKSTARFTSQTNFSDVDLFLFNKAAILDKQLLFSSAEKHRSEYDLRGDIHLAYAIETVSRDWLVIISPSSNFVTDPIFIPAALIFAIGIIAVLALTIYVYQTLRQTAVIKLKVAEKTSDLQSSERRFRRLFENSEISIWREDYSNIYSALDKLRAEGVQDIRQYLIENEQSVWEMAASVKVTDVNAATLELFGAKSEDDFIFQIDKTFGSNTIEVFRDQLCAIWNKEKMFRAEAEFLTIDGQTIDCILSLPLPETEEGMRSVPVSILDITDRKRLEKQVQHAQKMKAVGQLTGGIAHDFNNILGIIQGNFEILLHSLNGNENAKNRIEAGLKGTARGANLTRKLLDFSRKDAGSIQRISINHFIRDMEDLIAKSLTVSISVDLRLDDDAWLVDIDPGDLQDVIINLALNARDAMPNGGNLVIRSQNKVLDEIYTRRIQESKAGEFVQISVSDTGHGMEAEVKEHVLEPFFTTKEQGKGTGLGLSMAYGFIQRSGGHIEIKSEQGEGTTIHLYLPKAEKKLVSDQVTDTTETVSLPTGSGTILVVDDEEDLREIAVFHLNDLGYQTLTAENGDKALEVLGDGHDIDILFSDVVMPGDMDGYQLAVTAHEQYPKLRILLTSGFTNKRAKLRGAEDKYLVNLNDRILDKPYNRTELAIALKKTLNMQN